MVYVLIKVVLKIRSFIFLVFFDLILKDVQNVRFSRYHGFTITFVYKIKIIY